MDLLTDGLLICMRREMEHMGCTGSGPVPGTRVSRAQVDERIKNEMYTVTTSWRKRHQKN